MNSEKKLGVAIFGTGYWGINYIRIFEELPDTQIVVVCDIRPERLEEVKRRFPEVETTTEVDEALQMAGVDVAVICTQASTHYDIASRCLKAGKHTLIEKPITTISADAAKLLTLAKSKALTLMVGHTFIYNAGIRKMKSHIVDSQMGQIYYVYSRRTNLGPFRHDVNALWDLAPHDISIFNYLLDDVPQWVSAVGIKALGNSREDVGFIALGYPNNIVGHIHVSWVDPNKVREVVVVGSNKRVVFDDLNMQERVKIYEKGVTQVEPEATTYGEYQFMIRDGDILSPRVDMSEPLKNQCLHFLECVTQGISSDTPGRTGMEVVQVMEAVDFSLQHGGVPVPVRTTEVPDPIGVNNNGTINQIQAPVIPQVNEQHLKIEKS